MPGRPLRQVRCGRTAGVASAPQRGPGSPGSSVRGADHTADGKGAKFAGRERITSAGATSRVFQPFTDNLMRLRLRSMLLTALALGPLGCESREETPSSRGNSVEGGTTIRVTLAEWSVEMSPDTVRAGPVSFLVTNQGTDRHELEVEREDEEFEFGEIPAGAEQRFPADLKPGIYEVYCPLADATSSHKSRGMTARLVVR